METEVPSTRRPPQWANAYARCVMIGDGFVVYAAAVIALMIRFSVVTEGFGDAATTYVAITVLLTIAWVLALHLAGTYDERLLGDGPEEYTKVFNVSLFLFGLVAIVSYLFQFQTSRGYLGIALPIGLLALLLNRKFWRKRLQKQRAKGKASHNVMIIGGVDTAREIAGWLRRHATAGYRVSGVWVPDSETGPRQWLDVPDQFIPVFGSNHDLDDALYLTEADTVIVSDTEHLGHRGLRQLSWDLHDLDIDLMVSPNIMDVAGPRVHVRAVANMPLVHLEEPQFKAAATITKKVFDRIFAFSALVAISPMLLAIAIAVKLDSKGPVLYKSERIGKDGEAFSMLKFRSMRQDADLEVQALRDAHDVKNVLFKMADDPRVTRVGRFLRRYSLDELPQFINVLRGDMSVVGPRPPLRTEVDAYDDFAAKRLLVKQGITGLWQVSGRSDLDWEETVRLDLDYVENWSMMRDLQIIWRTIRAVVAKQGAY
ncbi:hypothetical protein BHE97_06995 [Aeromicrobium sp. PE09-221]|nr:hypothetical protein BHE97_06995 [Aeromicrobium sp. PE09-221]